MSPEVVFFINHTEHTHFRNRFTSLKEIKFQTDEIMWRRVELTDLSKLKEIITDELYQVFGFFDVEQLMYFIVRNTYAIAL